MARHSSAFCTANRASANRHGADFKDAKRLADDAIKAILTGNSSALKLNSKDRHTDLRSMEILCPLGVEPHMSIVTPPLGKKRGPADLLGAATCSTSGCKRPGINPADYLENN